MNLIIDEKWLKSTGWLIIAALLVNITSFFPEFVEKWYALGIYPLLANCLRFCFGWLPFSVGDFFYAAFLLWLARFVVIRLIALKSKPFNSILITCFLAKLLRFYLFTYLLFKLIWGFNYNRMGIAHQIGITKLIYTKEQVTTLTNALIDSTNFYRKKLSKAELPQQALPNIYKGAITAYQSVAKPFPFLQYEYPSIKSSLYTPWSDYVGFTGYYNPFSGEAQLRTDIPRMLVPFTTCHEIAHQIGYASESEASFVGFLAATASTDPYFKYSAYFDMLQYALGEQFVLYAQSDNYAVFDSIVQYNKSHIDTLVKQDRKMVRNFFLQHKTDISNISNSLYDQYLKLNQQLKGIQSYNEVIGWLIAYRRKGRKACRHVGR